MYKSVIIQASSRANGNTQMVVDHLANYGGMDVIKLRDYNIGHYDYEFGNREDDFRKLFKRLVEDYHTIVLATPIYWYTMSGLLKVFLDRFSDFLLEEKDFGRKLRRKQMAVVSCGSDDEIIKGFLMPFEKSAEYLGMSFAGHLHCHVNLDGLSNDMKFRILEFSNHLKQLEKIG